MATNTIAYSNFYSQNDIIAHTALSVGKNLLIDALREIFTNNNIYTYRQDQFGFPLMPDFTNLPNEEGGLQLDENGNTIPSTQLATKILITSTYHMDYKFYPVITVKQTGGKTHFLSFNQNCMTLQYRREFLNDGYGNQIEITTPTHYIFADAWDQTFEIKIVAEDIADRDDIADIVMVGLQHLKRDELRAAGLFIKDISMGGEQEEESQKSENKWLFTYVITVNTFSEWSRNIPIRDVVERINLYLDIERTGVMPTGSDILDNAEPNSAYLIGMLP